MGLSSALEFGAIVGPAGSAGQLFLHLCCFIAQSRMYEG